MTFLRVMGFSIALLLFYMGFGHILPQVEPDTSAPVEVSVEGLDMAGMIALGETLFTGKGTCTLCHNAMGRAPDTLVMDMAATYPERLADARYKGVSAGKKGAKAIEAYILESMTDPSAFVVEGFGKKGTNDTESPMPTVDKAPIELTVVEMNAVTAFLQDLAGLEPTVPLPSADEAPVEEDATDTEGMVAAALTTAEDVVDEYGCAACHDLGGSGADLGPVLHGIGNRMSKALVIEAIIDPNAVIADGYDADFMPDDFGEEMHVSELILLTDFLLALPDVAPVSEGDDEVATTGLEAIENHGCAGCHDLDGSEADLGPKLNGIGARMHADEIRAAILDPNAEIAEGYEAEIMPDYFGEDMTDGEIDLVIDYLQKLPE